MYIYIWVKYVFGPSSFSEFCKISPSSKLYTNLVLHLSKCVNLVFLTKF